MRRAAAAGPVPGLATAATAAHLATLTAAGAFILWLARDRWFIYDEWAFPALIHPLLVQGHWLRFFFAPYINHWVGVPNVIWALLFPAFGMRAYLPYLLPTLAAHLATTAMLRTVLLRAGLSPWRATLGVLPFLVTGAGAGNLVLAWQIEFVGASMFGLGQLLLSDHEGPPDRRDALGLGLGLLGLMCSGVAPAFVFLAGANLALRRRWTAAAIATLPLTAVFLAWYVAFGHRDIAGQPPPDFTLARLRVVPGFAWTGLTASAGGMVGAPGLGVAVLPAAVVGALGFRLWPRVPGASLAWAGALAAVFFFAETGYGRAANGAQFATQSRYLYIGIALLLPLVAVVVDRLTRRPPAAYAALAILAVVVGANLAALVSFNHDVTVTGLGLRAEVYRVATDPASAAVDPKTPITVPGAQWLTVGLVRELKSEGNL